MKQKQPKLKPLLKYPGGKSAELENIFKYAPEDINNYIEPFVGGGAVYFATDAQTYYINDKSNDLMSLYQFVLEQNDDFFDELRIITKNWMQLSKISNNSFIFFIDVLIQYKSNKICNKELKDIFNDYVNNLEGLDQPLFSLENVKQNLFKNQLIKNMVSMVKRIKRNEIQKNKVLEEKDLHDNYECALKSAYYMYFRQLYNEYEEFNLSISRKIAIYLFIREYCYSSMFRFNRDGKFNVPYGGISYNKKSLYTKIEYYKSLPLLEHLRKTNFNALDFFDFVNQLDINDDDFMFLDPPYDTEFSEYDKHSFDMDDQHRLANYLINDCPCKFMLIIKKTDKIDALYKNTALHIIEVDKNYSVSFKNRNNKDVKHLIIMNY